MAMHDCKQFIIAVAILLPAMSEVGIDIFLLQTTHSVLLESTLVIYRVNLMLLLK